MIDRPLDEFVCFPALRTRLAELRGLPDELRALRKPDRSRKARMLPLMTLV